MPSILSLIANPAKPVVDSHLAEAAREALAAAGSRPGEARWLAPGIALDLPLAAAAPERSLAAVRAALGETPVDANLIEAAGRRKRLLIADMDSTIVTTETLDEMAAFAGLKEKIAAITRRSMNGEIDFAAALRERVAMLAGLPVTALEKTLAATELTPGARALVQTMRQHGAFTALISGGFTFFTGAIRQRCGFHVDRSNVLDIADGKLTGRLAAPIVDRDAKLAALQEFTLAHGLAGDASLAVGDGANDLAMLGAAGFGVAFRAKPIVAAEARLAINHGDLTALLYLQGYRQDEFRE
ncbi:MAG: phosphoserine phosphatase SerB [Proteobacteria bacterium]|nr:phosphoserine phosphatase SerB [Pseudomonadota bacterium]